MYLTKWPVSVCSCLIISLLIHHSAWYFFIGQSTQSRPIHSCLFTLLLTSTCCIIVSSYLNMSILFPKKEAKNISHWVLGLKCSSLTFFPLVWPPTLCYMLYYVSDLFLHCTLSLFTIKVLTHLFQVEHLHKSFSFSLLPQLSLFSEEKLSVSSRDQSPDNHITASVLLIFSPLSSFSPPSVSGLYC